MTELGLEGRVIIVTGGGSGIGLATAMAFAAADAYVVAVDLDTSRLDGREGIVGYEIDLTGDHAGEELAAQVLEDHGSVDVLVNAVGGGAPQPDRLLSASDEDWRRTFELNLWSMVRVSRAVLPTMVAAKRGSIVSVASDAAREPDPMFVDYCAAKAGVIVVSKSIATEFGPYGIRSNVVSPGITRTPMTEGFVRSVALEAGITDEEAMEHIAKNVKRMPLGRFGLPGQVANVIVFLASDAAAHVTGSDYRVDGGIVAAA
jgi:NAD(P)-dependent dehydrogenase (short-subunit alcohol dehydrogenase family)